jgi:hypothetical protein
MAAQAFYDYCDLCNEAIYNWECTSINSNSHKCKNTWNAAIQSLEGVQLPPFEECVIELRRIYEGNISVHEIGVIRDVYDFIIGRQQS